MAKIKIVKGRQVFDSRGNPTVEAEIFLEDGSSASAISPSGASTGAFEAHELRDKDQNKFLGKSVHTAVHNINNKISNKLKNLDFNQQENIDKILLELDGSENKTNLGANATLAVSLAYAKCTAIVNKQSLYKSLGKSYSLPVPLMNIINGGAHADNDLNIQEFMIRPDSATNFTDAIEKCFFVIQNLKKLLQSKKMLTNVRDEGGFAPNLKTNDEVINFIIEAVDKSGYKFCEDIFLGLDCASTEFFHDGNYSLEGEGKSLKPDEMIDYLKNLVTKYQIVSLEDPLEENDWAGWAKLTKECGGLQIVGDDIYVTQRKLLQRGIDERAGNAILIKLNQIGTLTETLLCIELAKQHNFGTIISHRSGETEDTFISDLAVATDAKQIKTGAPARSDRTAKYNRLLVINDELYP